MTNQSLFERLLDRIPLMLILLGLLLVVIGAAGGWPNPKLQVNELGWRIALAAMGVAVAVVGGLLLWREMTGHDKTSPTSIACDAYNIKIVSPKAGEEVRVDYEISGTYGIKPPDGQIIQIFHMPPGASEYWPMIEASVTFDVNRKTWHTRARSCGEPGRRDIVVALMGQAGQALCNYYRKVGKETGQWPGIAILTPDIVECDRVTVMREAEPEKVSTTPRKEVAKTSRAEGALQNINFDYPDSPSLHGWQIRESTPSFKPIADGFVGGALEIQPTQSYAMDYYVDAEARIATQIEFVAKYKSDSTVYAFVTVQSKDGSKARDVWLSFLVGSDKPKPFDAGANEWTIYVTPVRKEGGWSLFQIDIRNAVSESFGRDGWTFKHLKGFRLRGNLAMARISAYR